MRRLEDRIEIDAPRQTVWGILSDFSGVATWAPYLRSCSPVGDVETGVGAYRVLRHFWGFQLEESVLEWNEGTGFSFAVLKVPYPLRNVHETWSLEGSNGVVTVMTSVEYETHLGRIGAALDSALIMRLVKREMRAGLEGLKEYAESIPAALAEVTAAPSEVADSSAFP